MNDKNKTKKISKFLSLILRHKPEAIGIKLDENGWVNVDELINKMNTQNTKIDRETLDFVVSTNDKKRFSFNNDKTKIRASQGHSLNIDLNYKAVSPPEILYHGTSQKSLDNILKTGISKQNRQHVHLSSDIETAIKVGQRHGKVIVLEVSSKEMHNAQHKFYLSENKVWLSDFIPIEYFRIIDKNQN